MLNKLKKVTIRDVLGIFKFLIVLIPAFIYKKYLKSNSKNLWLVCESSFTARDNGIVFYKYLINNQKKIKCYYAIDKSCNDYNSIKNLPNIIQWGSFLHYFIYMSSTRNISSHKEGNPNHTLFTFLHLYLNLYNNRVFLQHGVLYQNFEMFHQKNTKFKLFICGAKPEFDFVTEKYGYKNNEVQYTGLARFDNLFNTHSDPKVILYMPTFRRWIDTEEKMRDSFYYDNLIKFLNSKKLENILQKNDKYLYFCPHSGFRNFVHLFKNNNSRVKVIDIKNVNVQELLIKGSLLITDFSSLSTDFAYMKKPIIYYQFDEKDYREKHIGKMGYDTYFNYEEDGFGPVASDLSSLLEKLSNLLDNNLKVEEKYFKRIEKFFPLHDDKNCERIYNLIEEEKNE